jgi:hypothetical protein
MGIQPPCDCDQALSEVAVNAPVACSVGIGERVACDQMGVSELRKSKQLGDENTRLKRLLADLTLDRHILQEVLRKKV